VTESEIADYDAEEPIKCPKCQHMVVPVEVRVTSCAQVMHLLCCFVCVFKNWCGCGDENKELKKTVLNCPHCNSCIAAH
jgi:DNA-directed RNA polymerase subunit RPC12/RpoP